MIQLVRDAPVRSKLQMGLYAEVSNLDFIYHHSWMQLVPLVLLRPGLFGGGGYGLVLLGCAMFIQSKFLVSPEQSQVPFPKTGVVCV